MSDLTEQWKKGELPEGWYYCYIYDEEYKNLYYDGDCFELEDPETKNYYFFLLKDIKEIKILAPVPSYDEWKAKLEENAQLKELLKECELWFTVIVGNMNDKNVGEHNRKLPIGNFEYIFKVFSQKIDEVLK